MQKRVVTKVGYVYRTKDTSKGHRYFQLVAIDAANLNSDVIAVFTSVNPTQSEDYDQIAQSPIEFYMHTTTSQGVHQGLWEKVGKAPVHVDITKLAFKFYRDQDAINHSKQVAESTGDPKFNPTFPEPFWNVWSASDTEFHSVSGDEGLRFPAEWGAIRAADQVIDRIENGVKLPEKVWPAGTTGPAK
jgi:hypothetical protein